MADFKTHVTVGSFVGFFLTIFTFIMKWTSDFAMAILVFFATVIGSFLPDIDSDSGIPVRMLIGIIAFAAGGFAFYMTYTHNVHIAIALISPVAAFLLVWYIIQPLFKKYTVHRGIFHSFPAFLITFFGTLLIVDQLRLHVLEKMTYALAFAIGYLTHLILDEMYSTRMISGTRKKSLGTALDLGLKDRIRGVIAYLLLAALVVLTYPVLEKIMRKLF